jgi:hypothetical protein
MANRRRVIAPLNDTEKVQSVKVIGVSIQDLSIQFLRF